MPHVWIAQPGESDTVASLLAAFRDHWGRSEPSDESILAGVERLIDDPGTEYLLGAAAEGEPAAGVCQLRYRHSVWVEGEDCWLEDLFVADTARGTGLGRALAEATIARARERGSKRVELDVYSNNETALPLYRSLGFTNTTEPAGGDNLFLKLVL